MNNDSQRIKILIAEDEENLSKVLDDYLRNRGYQTQIARDGRVALEALKSDSFDVALLDIVMPELDGLAVLKHVREDAFPPECIIITGNGTIETAITAMKLGAYDYLSKPYRMAEIDALVRRAWEKRQLSRENALLQSRLSRLTATPEIRTQHAPMQAVLQMVERVAPSESPVLITGESGTGKELIARAIHRLSGRPGPLVDVSCAAIPENLIESELFGHEKGAFPGADSRKAGLFELAAGGTLFLDEVAELEPKVQAKLLRALEQGTFFRVGGTQKVEVNVRVIAASNRDLPRLVEEQRFRAELYYRINTISLELPPLRDRVIDVPVLAEFFLRQFGGPVAPRCTEAAIDALMRYHWPGNVRELRNVIERAVLLATGGVIDASDLPLQRATSAAGGAPESREAPVSLAELERRHIELVLAHANWHQGLAANMLGISSKTLYRKIREYGFNRPRGSEALT